MERYYKRTTSDSKSNLDDLDDLPWDPAERKKILDYHPNQRDEVRRKYLTRGHVNLMVILLRKKRLEKQ